MTIKVVTQTNVPLSVFEGVQPKTTKGVKQVLGVGSAFAFFCSASAQYLK